MGTVFKHIDDIEVVKALFPKDTSVEYLEGVYDDETLAGKVIQVNGSYDLIPVNGENTVKTIAGNRKRPAVVWDVYTYVYDPGVRYYKDGSGQPPSMDEVEVAKGLSFTDAIKKVHELMINAEMDCVLENFYYDDIAKDEKLNPMEYA